MRSLLARSTPSLQLFMLLVKSQLLALCIYFTLLTTLMKSLPDSTSRLVFFAVSHSIAGILHVQITLSHFAMPVHMGKGYDLSKPEMFVKTQLETSMDIECPWWMDWFHGK